MVGALVSELLFGIYLGLLAALFPALIAFAVGFSFRYFTNVTVPAFGVVVLSGALAGISGGLMGFVDPQLASDWTGITATAVILMASLWAHSQGDTLAAATPRGFTLQSLRENRLSVDLVERIDAFGQVTIHPVGPVEDLEGYPPLPAALRERLQEGTWKFPADLPRSDLELRLERHLAGEYELAAVSVTVDDRGRAEIAAAPAPAGLSRRVPRGKRAVSVETLLPTGLGRGDVVDLATAADTVTGTVVSARSEVAAAEEASRGSQDARPSGAGTTAGGPGRLTVAVDRGDAPALLASDHADLTVRPQATREFAAIDLLRRRGLSFRRVAIGAEDSLVGRRTGEVAFRETHGVALVAIDRPTDRLIAPAGGTVIEHGDSLIVVGRPPALDAFAGERS
jgi:hypothetical protein